MIAPLSEGMSIVQLGQSSLNDVLDMESRAHSHPWTTDTMRRALDKYLCFGLTADSGDGSAPLLAFAIVLNLRGEAELLDFVVDPDFQGRGHGRRLLEWLLDYLPSTYGVERFFLEVRESNQAAIGLYSGRGFSELGVRPDYYPAVGWGRENALIMAIELSLMERQ